MLQDVVHFGVLKEWLADDNPWDVFTKIVAAKRHYSAIGLGEDYVNRYLR
jgi:hypothetical protein